jgi:mannose-6-phosphate isomerase-like protein (cupin superfamily)
MLVQRLKDAPRNHRGGQVSYLLLAPGQLGSENVAITWVEGEPGSEQPVHKHPNSEQVYVVVRGRGVMRVGNEEREVEAGTMVLVPPRTGHAIRNAGEEPLVFVSATSPPFEMPPEGTVFAYEPASK